MDHREVTEAGRVAAGDEGSSALVLVPIGQAGTWTDEAAGVSHAKPDRGGGRKKGKAPAVVGQGSGDCLTRVRSPMKVTGVGGQPSPKKSFGVGGCSGSPKVRASSGEGVGSSPGKLRAKLNAKGVAGPIPGPGPLSLEGSCGEGPKVVGGKENREGVMILGEETRPAGGSGPAHCGPVSAGARGVSGPAGGGRGRRGDVIVSATGRSSRVKGRVSGDGREVEESPGRGEGECRVRSRSPVGLRRGKTVEQRVSGEQGDGALFGGTSHGERVARLRRAMLGAQSEVGGEDVGGGVGDSHLL